MLRRGHFVRIIGALAATGTLAAGIYHFVPSGGGQPRRGGANLWIDTDGGACTRSASPAAYDDAAACGSLDSAYQAASAGDTVLIRGGSYAAEQTVEDKPALDALSPGCSHNVTSNCVTFRPAGGADVTFSADMISIRASNLRLLGHVSGPTDPARWDARRWDLHVRTVETCPDNFCPAKQSHLVFQNVDGTSFSLGPADTQQIVGGDWGPQKACVCTYHENKIGPDGTVPNKWPTNILLEGIYVHDQQTSDNRAHMGGLFLISGGPLTLRNSVFKRNVVYDIQIQDFNRFVGGWNSGPVHDLTIENNWFGQPVDCLAPCGNPKNPNGSQALQFDPFAYDRGASPCGRDWCNILIRYNSFSDGSVNFGNDFEGGAGVSTYSNVRLVGNTGSTPSQLAANGVPIGSCTATGLSFDHNVWAQACGASDGIGTGFYANATPTAFDLHLRGGLPVNFVPNRTADERIGTDIEGNARPLSAKSDAGADEASNR